VERFYSKDICFAPTGLKILANIFSTQGVALSYIVLPLRGILCESVILYLDWNKKCDKLLKDFFSSHRKGIGGGH
jgi:hypothetical protein